MEKNAELSVCVYTGQFLEPQNSLKPMLSFSRAVGTSLGMIQVCTVGFKRYRILEHFRRFMNYTPVFSLKLVGPTGKTDSLY